MLVMSPPAAGALLIALLLEASAILLRSSMASEYLSSLESLQTIIGYLASAGW